MYEWQPVAIGGEGNAVDVLGLNPWEYEWDPVPSWGRVEVRHPSYPNQKHLADRYRVRGPGGWVEFAAVELSNGVWGFYVQRRRESPS